MFENKDLIALFSSFLDGTLSEEERILLENRLKNEPALKREFDAYCETDRLFKMLPKKNAPEDFQEILQNALCRRRTRIRFNRPRHATKPLWPLLTAAAGVLVVLSIALYQTGAFKSPGGIFEVASQPKPMLATATDESDVAPVRDRNPQKDIFIVQGKKSAETFEVIDSASQRLPSSSNLGSAGPETDTSVVDRQATLQQAPDSERRESMPLIARKRLERNALSEETEADTTRFVGGIGFTRRGGEWHQSDYRGEPVELLDRNAKLFLDYISTKPQLQPLLEWTEPVILRIDKTWYRVTDVTSENQTNSQSR